MLDRIAWFAFLILTPLLWASGVWLFAHSGLAARKKVLWTLFLVVVGVAMGLALPLAAIRNRFLVLFALLPLVALIDLKLARSSRTVLFWVRACAFEVCTVVGCAALTRLALGQR